MRKLSIAFIIAVLFNTLGFSQDDVYYTKHAKLKLHGEFNHQPVTLQIGQTSLTFYLAPGHTADGIFTLLEPDGIWIAGDYLSKIEFPFIYDSWKAYLETLSKVESILQNHEVKCLIPGHGDATFSLEEMKTRATDSVDYIQKMRQSVLSKKPFQVEELWKKYDFPNSLNKAHRENVAMMKKESRR